MDIRISDLLEPLDSDSMIKVYLKRVGGRGLSRRMEFTVGEAVNFVKSYGLDNKHCTYRKTSATPILIVEV